MPAVSKKPCVHHWLIESPAGPTSEGRCRRCRAVKTFSNRNPEVTHDETIRQRIGLAAKKHWQAYRDAKRQASEN
jgi:hypothetical protein